MYQLFISVLISLCCASVPSITLAKERALEFQADEITIDEKLGTIIAIGNIILVHENYTLYAQSIAYDQRNNTLIASERIRLELTNGETFFADSLRFSSDIREAFLEKIQLLFAHHGKFTGETATLENGTILRIQQGAYTACRVCQNDPSGFPLWQIRSKEILRNKQTQQLTFYDVTLDMFGFPVFYLPYVSLPDPTVQQQSGLVDASAGWHGQFGNFATFTTYLNLNPQYDLTNTLTLYTNTLPLSELQIRRRFQTGNLDAKGTVTYSTLPQEQQKKQLRGHLQAHTVFNLTDRWRTSADLQWTSDPSFLQQYFNQSTQRFLESQIVAERFLEHDYLSLNALWFQSQFEHKTLDQPLVFPMLSYTLQGSPTSLLNGTWSLHTNVRYIQHSQSNRNIKKSRKLSLEPSWHKSLLTPIGLFVDFKTRIHINAASVTFDQPTYTSKRYKQYLRILPQAVLDFRFPWYCSFTPWYHLIEPRIAFFLAPTSPKYFPNEDTLDITQDAVSLFLHNRFTGTDLQEYGQRLSYGIHYTLKHASSKLQLFFGHHRYLSQKNTRLTPYSAVARAHSDYLGRIHLKLFDALSTTYHLQLDSSGLYPTNQSLQFLFVKDSWNLKAHYTHTSASSNAYGHTTPKEKFFSLDMRVPLTKYWKTHMTYQHNFLPRTGPHKSSVALTYEDECFQLKAGIKYNYQRSFTAINDVTILFNVSFKHAK